MNMSDEKMLSQNNTRRNVMKKIILTLLAGTVLLAANVALATEQPTAQDCPTISQIGTTKLHGYYYFSAINNAGNYVQGKAALISLVSANYI